MGYSSDSKLRRAFDIVASGTMAILSAPAIIGISVIMRYDLKENPFFVQKRLGQ